MGSSNSGYTRLKKQIKAAKKKNKVLKKQKKYNKKRTNKKLNKKKYLSFSKAFMKIVKTKTFIISSVIVLGIILYFVILNAVEKSKSNKDNGRHEPKPGPPIPPPSPPPVPTAPPLPPIPHPQPDVPSSDSSNNVKTGDILLFVFSLLFSLFMLFGWFCHVNPGMCDTNNSIFYILVKPFEIIVEKIQNSLAGGGGGGSNWLSVFGKFILIVIVLLIVVILPLVALVKIAKN